MKKISTKLVAISLAAAMMSAMVGCGANNASQAAPEATDGAAAETATATEAAASGETTDVALKVWVPNNQIDTGILDEQEAAFEKLHPEWNITWTNEIVGDDVCKDELLKDVDAAGDVFMFASDQLTSLVEAGAIAQLGGEAEAMVKENIAESVRATAMVGDEIYAIPYTHNTFFMFYDKTIMDEKDVKSLETIMAKDTADDVYNFYFESSGGWKLGAYYYGAGLTVFGPEGNDKETGVNWNNETGLAVTNYLIDLINNPKCAYDGEISVSELIESHRLGAWFDGAWNYDLYHDVLGDDMGLAVIPTFNPDGKDYQMLSFYGSKCIGVNAHSKNMAPAVAFATFMGNEENQLLRFEKSAQIPAHTGAAASEAVTSNELAAVIVAEANTASVMQPAASMFSSVYWTYAGAIPTEIRSGEITHDNAQEKLDTFVKNMTAE